MIIFFVGYNIKFDKNLFLNFIFLFTILTNLRCDELQLFYINLCKFIFFVINLYKT